jgi:hypothetical protein
LSCGKKGLKAQGVKAAGKNIKAIANKTLRCFAQGIPEKAIKGLSIRN